MLKVVYAVLILNAAVVLWFALQEIWWSLQRRIRARSWAR